MIDLSALMILIHACIHWPFSISQSNRCWRYSQCVLLKTREAIHEYNKDLSIW